MGEVTVAKRSQHCLTIIGVEFRFEHKLCQSVSVYFVFVEGSRHSVPKRAESALDFGPFFWTFWSFLFFIIVSTVHETKYSKDLFECKIIIMKISPKQHLLFGEEFIPCNISRKFFSFCAWSSVENPGEVRIKYYSFANNHVYDLEMFGMACSQTTLDHFGFLHTSMHTMFQSALHSKLAFRTCPSAVRSSTVIMQMFHDLVKACFAFHASFRVKPRTSQISNSPEVKKIQLDG